MMTMVGLYPSESVCHMYVSNFDVAKLCGHEVSIMYEMLTVLPLVTFFSLAAG